MKQFLAAFLIGTAFFAPLVIAVDREISNAQYYQLGASSK